MTGGSVFRLGCAVQSYAWGKIGSDSTVASLSTSGNPSFTLENDKPYAEMWMGTHSKGPSVCLTDNRPLSTWLTENPEYIGTSVSQSFPTTADGQLPFLFKVLSVNKSLSIQAHPNKAHAEILHATRPENYPDPNHKPEMAIALTRFQAMCGFRPHEEICSFMKSIPELADIIGEAAIGELVNALSDADIKAALCKCFTALMTCNPEVVMDKLNALVNRFKSEGSSQDGDPLQTSLLLRLSKEFPGDVGCFCIYFLNVLELNPGEAIFLEANLPHAYLHGDCIECMACSDNVVRAGLTPKFKDVDVLCSMLNYRCLPAAENYFHGVPDATHPNIMTFNPPIPDFAVDRVKVPAGQQYLTILPVDSASILLVIEGQAHSRSNPSLQLCRGSVLFIAAKESLMLDVTSAEGMLMFKAYCRL